MNEIIKHEKEKTEIIKQSAWIGLSHNSQESYKYDYKLFFKVINKNVKDINVADILEFIEYLEVNNYRPSSINRKMASISKMFDVLKHAGEIAENPIHMVKKIKRINKSVDHSVSISLSIDDIKSVTNIKTPDKYENQLSMIISILAQTGLRITEFINIKYTDIKEHDKKYLKIRIMGKGKKERFIYFPKTEFTRIKKLWPSLSEYVFYNYKQDKYCRKFLWFAIKKRFRDLLKKDVHPHMLRHFFITYKISTEKKDVKAVSRYAGHANVSTTLQMYVDTALDASDAGIKI